MAVGHGKIPRARQRLNDLIESLEDPTGGLPSYTKVGKVALIRELRSIEAMLYREPAAQDHRDEREFGGDMDDRAVMEAHGIDVDCTPVDTFMDRDMGYCLCPED